MFKKIKKFLGIKERMSDAEWFTFMEKKRTEIEIYKPLRIQENFYFSDPRAQAEGESDEDYELYYTQWLEWFYDVNGMQKLTSEEIKQRFLNRNKPVNILQGETRVFKIPVGTTPPEEVDKFIKKITEKFKKPIIDPSTGEIDFKYTPIKLKENFFMGTPRGQLQDESDSDYEIYCDKFNQWLHDLHELPDKEFEKEMERIINK